MVQEHEWGGGCQNLQHVNISLTGPRGLCGLMICDAAQQNREQVGQAYFEIRSIEVSIGVKNNSSVDFEIFGFLTNKP